MGYSEKKANLAEELRRLNDILESERGRALPGLNEVLGCGGISAVIALTEALDRHTQMMSTMTQQMSEHSEILCSTTQAMVDHSEELRRHSSALCDHY